MKKSLFIAFAIIALLYVVVWEGLWVWTIKNVVVPPDQMLVLVAKTGKEMPPGRIIAEKGEKGVLLEPLGPGRHFINPFLYERQLKPQVVVGPGQVGVVVAKFGNDLPTGEFLAGEGDRGIQRDVLLPGVYKLNPYAYELRVVQMVEIDPGFVGVVNSRSGRTATNQLAEAGERGVMRNVLPPGLYAINPEAFIVERVEIGYNQITMAHSGKLPATQTTAAQGAVATRYAHPIGSGSGKTGPTGSSTLPVLPAVTFPSSDGFDITIDVTVLWQLRPEDAPSVYARYGNISKIEQNILIPQINSTARIKGSTFGAVNFIVGEEREQFQSAFQQMIESTLVAKQLQVDMALVQDTIVPDTISGPIQDARVAEQWNLTNVEKIKTAAKKAELDETQGKIQQIIQVVEFETQRLEGNLNAERERAEQEINAQTLVLVSDLRQQTASVNADIARKLGSAEAKVMELKGQATGDGYAKLVQAAGTAADYAAYQFAQNLPLKLSLSFIYAGNGTLWTDLKESASLGALGTLKQNQEKK
jgi:hypothetical protein